MGHKSSDTLDVNNNSLNSSIWDEVYNVIKNSNIDNNIKSIVMSGFENINMEAAKPFIMTIPRKALSYARDVIKGRWPEAEPYIMKDPESALSYARDVIKGRWPEAEPYIMKDQESAFAYATDVINGRWPELEKVIGAQDMAAQDMAMAIYLKTIFTDEVDEWKSSLDPTDSDYGQLHGYRAGKIINNFSDHNWEILAKIINNNKISISNFLNNPKEIMKSVCGSEYDGEHYGEYDDRE